MDMKGGLRFLLFSSALIIIGLTLSSCSQLIRWFIPGCDKLFFRWYAMFAEDFDQGNLMHWTGIRGTQLALGTYFAGLAANGAVITRKIVLIC